MVIPTLKVDERASATILIVQAMGGGGRGGGDSRERDRNMLISYYGLLLNIAL